MTSGRPNQVRPLDTSELARGKHDVTHLKFPDVLSTWLLIKTLDTGGQEVVGHIQFFPWSSNGPIEISYLCTRQGQGYGTILISSLFHHYRDSNFNLYSLDTARRFYSRLGFKSSTFTHEPSTWNQDGDVYITSWQVKRFLQEWPTWQDAAKGSATHSTKMKI